MLRIGPYRLEEPLGAGGMGAVWRAWDERLKRSVAVKRLLPSKVENPRLRERFRREAEAEARLNHPAIVHIYDILETDDGDWIVMELVEGRTLRQLLKDGPLEVPRAIRLGREIAEGLAEAHAHGIIHRDLKAGNVMVTLNDRAKILDFGVAKQIQPQAEEATLSETGMIVGTVHAMSPEQAMGLPLDTRSDLFSLGSLLYVMVTGALPFDAATPTATLARVCSYHQLPAWKVHPGVPQELSTLIDRLLEKEPSRRLQSAAEVAAVLESLAQDPAGSGESRGSTLLGPANESEPETIYERIPSLAEAPAQPAWETGSRSRRVWPALAILLVLALALLQQLDSGAAPPLEAYELHQQGMASLARFDKEGNLDAAIESFQEALARNERYAPAYAGLARACWLKFDGESKDPLWLSRAREAAQRAVELDEYLAAAQVSLGLVRFASGEPGPARQSFERALLLEPANADAFYGLGRLHQSQGRLKQAEEAYRRAAEIRPDRLFFDTLGSVYLREGRLEDAIRASQRSIALAPDGYIGYRNLATAYYSQGKLSEAASQLQKALEIRPRASLYSNLGTIHFAQGFYGESAAAFEKALAMPGGANDYLVWGNLGDAYRWMPDQEKEAGQAYQRAIQLLEDRLAAAPADVTLKSRLALYLAKRGDRDRALAQIAETEKLRPEDPQAWYRLAVGYEACGRRDPALAALGRALQAGLPLEEIKADPELLRLREDARYHLLIAGYESERR